MSTHERGKLCESRAPRIATLFKFTQSLAIIAQTIHSASPAMESKAYQSVAKPPNGTIVHQLPVHGNDPLTSFVKAIFVACAK